MPYPLLQERHERTDTSGDEIRWPQDDSIPSYGSSQTSIREIKAESPHTPPRRNHLVPHLGTPHIYLCSHNHLRNVCMGVIIFIVLCIDVLCYMCGGNSKWGE